VVLDIQKSTALLQLPCGIAVMHVDNSLSTSDNPHAAAAADLFTAS